MKKPTEKDLEVIKRTAVLAVATLTYPRTIASVGDTLSPESARIASGRAFNAAEVFVEEAIKRGYDPASIMSLAVAVGL